MGFVNLKIQTEKEKYDELKHRGGSRKQSNELEEAAEPAPFYSIHLQTMCSLFRERQGKREEEEEEEKKSERETETEKERERDGAGGDAGGGGCGAVADGGAGAAGGGCGEVHGRDRPGRRMDPRPQLH